MTTVREQAIEAGARAAIGVLLYAETSTRKTLRETGEAVAAAVVDAVAPIIRADEQKRSAVGIEDEITLDVRRAERERLRAQVKALPLIDYDKDDDELIRRADVLAALGDAP